MTTDDTTPPVRMIPARALTLLELEEIVRALVDIANGQYKLMEDVLAGADDATAGA